MMKDDAKEQISLFDLPQQEKQAKVKAEVKEKQAREKGPQKRKEAAKPSARETKRKEAPIPARMENPAKTAPGQVPEGDVRLTANIRQDLHLKLKIAAAHRRTTIGELIEELVESYL